MPERWVSAHWPVALASTPRVPLQDLQKRIEAILYKDSADRGGGAQPLLRFRQQAVQDPRLPSPPDSS
jgi:hypothetical protein